MFDFSPNLSLLYDEYPFIERFAHAKASRFKYYNFDYNYDLEPSSIKKAAGGMECILMHAYLEEPYGLGYASVPGQEYNIVENLQRLRPFYTELGVKKVHILSGLRNHAISVADQLLLYVNGLRSINDFLERFNMTAVIEPLSEDLKPDYFLNSFDLVVQALNTLNLSKVKLLLDIHELHQMMGSVVVSLEKYYPYAGHIQISQYPYGNEPFSDGDIDYDFVFDFLRKKNHTEPIGLEYIPSEGTSTKESLEWMQQVRYPIIHKLKPIIIASTHNI